MFFLRELRRRRVFRLAALYIVGAWVFLQVADLAFESWDISSSALRYVWLAALLGFPVALIFAWRYDITPGGIVRTPPPEDEAQVDLSLKRSDYVILALLMTVAVGIIYQLTLQISDSGSARLTGPGQRQVDLNSIAVLPLDNLSGDPEQTYFVEGMQEALIAGLSRISALKVTSRTSTQRYGNTTESLPSIAAELGVAKLIEGAIFRVGDRVRITVNLVDAELDKQIWSQTFEDQVQDVLVLQSEVAEAIARQVNVTITPQEKAHLRNVKSVNPQAYDAFLKAQLQALDVEGDAEPAIRAAERAIELDPSFAPGYAFLSDLYGYLAIIANVSDGDAYLRARQLARKSVELDPELPYARIALARVHFQFEWDWASAQSEFERGIGLDPNNSTALNMYGAYRVIIHNDCEGGLALLEAARDRDPFNPGMNFDLGVYNFHCRRHQESIKHFERTIELAPGFYRPRMMIAWNQVFLGALEQAASQCDAVIEEAGQRFDPGLVGSCSWVNARAGRMDRALQLLEQVRHPPAGIHVDPVTLSFSCLGIEDHECAIDQLEEALRQRSSTMIYIRVSPLFDPIRDDPRFQAILDKMDFPA